MAEKEGVGTKHPEPMPIQAILEDFDVVELLDQTFAKELEKSFGRYGVGLISLVLPRIAKEPGTDKEVIVGSSENITIGHPTPRHFQNHIAIVDTDTPPSYAKILAAIAATRHARDARKG